MGLLYKGEIYGGGVVMGLLSFRRSEHRCLTENVSFNVYKRSTLHYYLYDYITNVIYMIIYNQLNQSKEF